MTGKTLLEKRYGEGFREGPLVRRAAPWEGCAVELGAGHPCRDAVYGSMEFYVDDPIAPTDWYGQLLARLPVREWVRLKLCQGHLLEAIQRSEDYQTTPDLWAPGRSSPPVLPRPPEILRAPTGTEGTWHGPS